MSLNTLLLQSNAETNPVISFIILIVFVIGAIYYFSEKAKKVAAAYAEYQEALRGTDKKLALAKGRHYVSLVSKSSRLLKEIQIQNDLHGMDDALKS